MHRLFLWRECYIGFPATLHAERFGSGYPTTRGGIAVSVCASARDVLSRCIALSIETPGKWAGTQVAASTRQRSGDTDEPHARMAATLDGP